MLSQKEMPIQRTIKRYHSNPLHIPCFRLSNGIQNSQMVELDSKMQL